MAGGCADIAQLARALANDSDRLGYPGMAQSAKQVAMAAEDEKADSLRDAIIDLTDLAQRIRRGHRGAA